MPACYPYRPDGHLSAAGLLLSCLNRDLPTGCLPAIRVARIAISYNPLNLGSDNPAVHVFFHHLHVVFTLEVVGCHT
jgi:hypothetical protein